MTYKAVGTIWRALSKPPKRRQGPDVCPLWLFVGTFSAIWIINSDLFSAILLSENDTHAIHSKISVKDTCQKTW